MNKRLLLTGLAFALGAGFTLSAYSQVKPEIMVKQRLAALLAGKLDGFCDIRGKVVVAILSGGNVDAELFAKLIAG